MPKLNLNLINGVEHDALPVSQREANYVKEGFAAGSPFAFTDDDGAWVWFNPDAFAEIHITED